MFMNNLSEYWLPLFHLAEELCESSREQRVSDWSAANEHEQSIM